MAGLACARVPAQDGAAQRGHKVSLRTLQEAVAARFPVRFGLARLLEVRVGAPTLFLLPERNKLGATLQADVAGAELRRAEAGEIDVAFGLRYEPADRTVRATRLEVLAFRAPGLPPDTLQALNQLLPALARDAVGEVVLHTVPPRDLALADTMGLEPQEIRVVHDGLLVVFGPRPGR